MSETKKFTEEQIEKMNIYQKLLEVKKFAKHLVKINKGEQYDFVSSAQVLVEVRDKLNEMGLWLTTEVTDKRLYMETEQRKDKYGNMKNRTTYFTEVDLLMTWVNVHNPDEKITVPWYSQGVDIGGEKGIGKALTYGEKYFMLKQFNIPTDKDDPDFHQKRERTEEQQHEEQEAKPANEKQMKYFNDLVAKTEKAFEEIHKHLTKDDVIQKLKDNGVKIENADQLSSGQCSASIKLLQGWIKWAQKAKEDSKKASKSA